MPPPSLRPSLTGVVTAVQCLPKSAIGIQGAIVCSAHTQFRAGLPTAGSDSDENDDSDRDSDSDDERSDQPSFSERPAQPVADTRTSPSASASVPKPSRPAAPPPPSYVACTCKNPSLPHRDPVPPSATPATASDPA